MLLSQVAFSQKYFLGIIKPGATCPIDLTFSSSTNLVEDPPGTWVLTNPALDGNAKAIPTITVTDSARLQCEYQSGINTDHFALCWDANASLATSYYATAKFVVFVYAGEYWYNYNSAGAINTTIPAVNGQLFCLFRNSSGNIYAQYKPGAYWVNLALLESANSSVLTQYISAANDGATPFAMLNPKYCIY